MADYAEMKRTEALGPLLLATSIERSRHSHPLLAPRRAESAIEKLTRRSNTSLRRSCVMYAMNLRPW